MATSTSTKQAATRLIRLRERLGMSQRELAREFDVTSGAINHWEKGIRPIPGPVLKLVELYEHYLKDEESCPKAQNAYFRDLSATWTERTLTVLRTFTRVRDKGEVRERMEQAFFSFLRGELSKDAVKRKIQLALLSRAIESVGQMKGLPLKAAQLLTYMSPEIAPEIREVLSSIQYMRNPMAPTLAARVIYEELGESPAKLFAEWSPKPFATASIGQVHRARLKTGEPVAVKVQYPDVRKSLEADFRGISILHDLASLVKPGNREIIDHISRIVIDECDYARELENLEEFRNLFAAHPEIVIPKPYPALSRKRVLTMDLIEGKTLPEFLASSTQEERNRAGEIIWKFTMVSQLRNGLMNADAHAGNFLFLKDKVAFLDFGRVFRVDREVIRVWQDLCICFSKGDRAGAMAALEKMPIVADPAAFDFEEFWKMMEVQQRHGVSGTSFRFSHEYIAEGMRATRQFPKDGVRLTNDTLWCNCSSQGLWSVFAELGAEARWGDLAIEFVRGESGRTEPRRAGSLTV